MLLVVLLVTVGTVRVSKCDKPLTLPSLPPLPDYIARRFRTVTIEPLFMAEELNTEQMNKSPRLSNLLEESNSSDTASPREPTVDFSAGHGGHHHHHHPPSHSHSHQGKHADSEAHHSNHDAVAHATGQDSTDATEETAEVTDSKLSSMDQPSTAEPLHDTSAAEMEKSPRNSDETKNSETGGKNPDGGSGIVRSSEVLISVTLLAVSLFVML